MIDQSLPFSNNRWKVIAIIIYLKFYNLLVNIEVESTELLTFLGELEVGAGLEPGVVGDGANY